MSGGILLEQMTSFAFVEEIQRYLKRRNLEVNYSDSRFMLAAFFQVLRSTLSLLHSKMADSQNLPTSVICFCINTKDPKQMKQQKVKAILGRLLGCFPVRFVTHREPFGTFFQGTKKLLYGKLRVCHFKNLHNFTVQRWFSVFTRSELGKDQSTRIRVETTEILRLFDSVTP